MVKIHIYCPSATAKSLQSCPTLYNPTDGSPPGSHPWDSPGKNTGAGFHFLSPSDIAKNYFYLVLSSLTLIPPTLVSPIINIFHEYDTFVTANK